MAKTLLNAVNEILKKAGQVNTTTALSSLTDTAKQVFIDQAVQSVNETLIELYTKTGVPMPQAVGSTTLTLVTGDRDYDLALTDLSRIIWPITDPDNDYEIHEYPGGWPALYVDKPLATDWEGRAEYAVVRPTDGELMLDLTPTSTENGLTYIVYYEKDTLLTAAADTMPFNDIVFTAILPAFAERYKQVRNAGPDGGVYRQSLATAARLLPQSMPRHYY